MKLKYYFSILIVVAFSISLMNCNKENTQNVKTKLEVFVKKNSDTGPFMPDISVELYKSIADTAGVFFKTAKTPTVNLNENGALFEDLAEQVYYIKVSFTDSGKVYEGFDEINVLKNSENSIQVIAISLGSFQVFVREDNKNGPFVGDAKVELFLSEADRTNSNPIQVKYTPSVDFDKVGAMFENLPYQIYYLRASYTNPQGYRVGITDGFAEKGKTINKHITCVL